MKDLYEFPDGHTGRKTYVHVRGHKRSIPKIYTYKGSDGLNYIHPDYGGTWGGMPHGVGPMIMSDIKSYVSPLDRSIISSRSGHRDHMRQHGVIEVGTEPIGTARRAAGEAAPMTPVGRDIARSIDQLRSR